MKISNVGLGLTKPNYDNARIKIATNRRHGKIEIENLLHGIGACGAGATFLIVVCFLSGKVGGMEPNSNSTPVNEKKLQSPS